ncbi:hypothetical protein ACFSDD_08405 [Salipiger marinus]|uniref:hypothetical protein n=1 Tax=Salipiger marinus TaxID=555512 RepID=UPI001E3D4D52|nr:hypothetical protein [Salipiger manganoxidans]MBU2327930.1 hypothetical protein [Alphaproteobacteria bacterium]MCD1619527.1 hypothetical protein [Salipiger manganoxidans]MEB3419510.1 hypothetical protein [Salipiger manganoxidans]
MDDSIKKQLKRHFGVRDGASTQGSLPIAFDPRRVTGSQQPLKSELQPVTKPKPKPKG